MEIPNCRNCNSDKLNQFIRADFVFGGTEQHKFWECKECGLVYLYPIPSENEEANFYAKEFEKFMASRSGGDRDWTRPEAHIRTNQDHVERRWKYLGQYLSKGKNLLEIGCSSGFMLDAFKTEGLNVMGIEPSGTFSNFLESRGHIFYKSIEELLADNSKIQFDIIVHFFVLEHIRDTKDFIEKQLKLLKTDGIIIAEVPCVNDPLTSIYNIAAFEKFYWSIAHHYYFNPQSLSYVLDQIDCKYQYIPEQRYDLSNHITWMLDGRPGGQGRYNNVFSKSLIDLYKEDLKKKWLCDTIIIIIQK